MVLNSRGDVDEEATHQLRTSHLFCVQQASIRCFDPLGAKKNELFTIPPHFTEEVYTSPVSRAVDFTQTRKELRIKRAQRNALNSNNLLIQCLEMFINTNPLMSQLKYRAPANPYKDVVVTKVLFQKGKVYLVNIEGPGSTFCINKGACHNSSHVYFEVKATGLVQKCFCKKVTPKPCSEFASPSVTLPVDLLRLLFPNVAESFKVPSAVLKQRTAVNMQGCLRTVSGKQKRQVAYQSCVSNYKKQVEYYMHLALHGSHEDKEAGVPLSKDVMYPSNVSSQLCRFTTEQIETASAKDLMALSEEMVRDLVVPVVPNSRSTTGGTGGTGGTGTTTAAKGGARRGTKRKRNSRPITPLPSEHEEE